MITGGKIRIYDLARSKIPEELDEKIKKKIQAELTREILKIAPSFGQIVKTASSSIDEDVIAKIFEKIDLDQILETEAGITNTNPRKPSASDEAPKKQLRIVRRIKAVEEEPVTPIEEPLAIVDEASSDKSEANQQDDEDSETIINIDQADSSNQQAEDLQSVLQAKKTNYSRDSVAYRDMSNIRSLPLKPVSSMPITSTNPTVNVDNQPYRVARPTISSQGMGRKKKRSNYAEDNRPKPVRKASADAVPQGPKEITITKPMTVR
ncbi:MAG: hypothetical protein LW817_08750, partial [Candidatus Caenarcaniphilales bacterium]|nr:hypothetical protein [Candidatus Caenarcaniphilales bacterium]